MARKKNQTPKELNIRSFYLAWWESKKSFVNKEPVYARHIASYLNIPESQVIEFINENPKLIISEPIYNPKVKNPRKPMAILIKEVYLSPKNNYRNEEYELFKKKINEKTIFLYFLNSEESIFIVDTPENSTKFKEYLWRNTQEKFDFLVQHKIGEWKKILSEEHYILTEEDLLKLKKLKWECIFFKNDYFSKKIKEK